MDDVCGGNCRVVIQPGAWIGYGEERILLGNSYLGYHPPLQIMAEDSRGTPEFGV
jgi:hypothetical protein